MLYIAITLIGFPEREAWKKTPYQISELFSVHKRFNPDQYKQDERQTGIDPIDVALGGL